jgi:RNA polymerase nonessential primary-like sigma factor
VSLETKVGDGDDTELLDLLAAEGTQPEELVDGECLRSDMQGLLEQLPDLQCRVLKMRYGIGIEEPMSLSSIARELEMSRDRARSLERRAHEEMRRLSREMGAYLAA